MNEHNINYTSIILHKMLNLLMFEGKKQKAQGILMQALEASKEKLGLDVCVFTILNQAVFNASPDIEVKSKKIGTNIYQIPRSITTEKKLKLGIKNLLDAARLRKDYSMVDKLSIELVEAYNFRGLAVKKKEEMHKIAEANKSFSHFNW